jgi:hypothetical protein
VEIDEAAAASSKHLQAAGDIGVSTAAASSNAALDGSLETDFSDGPVASLNFWAEISPTLDKSKARSIVAHHSVNAQERANFEGDPLVFQKRQKKRTRPAGVEGLRFA